MNNLFCQLGLHKWIGVHEHRGGDYDVAACVAGCICLRCGGIPIFELTPVLVVENGKIISK